MGTPRDLTKPSILALRVSNDATAFKTVPARMYSAEAAQRAMALIGRDGYTVLRTKALQGLLGQRAGVDVLMGPLEAAIQRRDALPEGSDERAEAFMTTELLGRETHWQAIHRIGQAVEGLCSLVAAMEQYRDGATSEEISTLLVYHDLDLQRLLGGKSQRKVSYWEKLGARPQAEALLAAGLTPEESKLLLASNRSWAWQIVKEFAKVSRFYTGPLHHLYAKYRHGYTIVNPMVSPLYLSAPVDLKMTPAELNQSVGKGFAVMHEDRTGRRTVYIVETGVDEVRLCVDVARFVIELTRRLAVAWLVELEHPQRRGITFDQSAFPVARKWIGSGLDDVYDISRQLEAAARTLEEPTADATTGEGPADE